MKQATVFETIGNVELLSQVKLAIFSSRSIESGLSEKATALFTKLCQLPITLASGWQAPLEKTLFKNISSQTKANFIYYLAKDINQFKPSDQQQQLLNQNRLLVIAPVLKEKRTSEFAVKKRDELLFAQVKNVLFLYIKKNGRLERYLNQLSTMDYRIYFLDHHLNDPLIFEDAVPVSEDNISGIFFT